MNRRFLAALLLVAVALVINVSAQDKVRFDVPFDFVVADRVLPAATYDLSDVAAHEVLIRNFGNGSGTMIQAWPASGKQIMHAKLVFHKYGDRYFLYQAWNVDGQGIQLRESKLEKEHALASSMNSAPQEVVIALR